MEAGEKVLCEDLTCYITVHLVPKKHSEAIASEFLENFE